MLDHADIHEAYHTTFKSPYREGPFFGDEAFLEALLGLFEKPQDALILYHPLLKKEVVEFVDWIFTDMEIEISYRISSSRFGPGTKIGEIL